MKFKLNALLIGLSAVFVSSSAMATISDIALDATGSIVASSCDVEFQDTTGTATTTIAVSPISESQVFATGLSAIPDDATLTTNFNLAFTGCVNTEQVDISFTLGTQTGDAAGVDLVLIETGAELTNASLTNTLVTGASVDKSFTIGYKKTANSNGDVVVGNIARTISFTAEYL